MSTVSVSKKNPQSDQSSANSDSTQVTSKGGGTASSHPLRVKAKPSVSGVSVKVPPVAVVKPREEPPAKGSAYQGSLGCWQDQIMAIATPAPVVRPVVVAATKGESSEHARRRSRSGERKDKFSVKKAFRNPSCSPEKEPCETKKQSHKKNKSSLKKHSSRKDRDDDEGSPVRIHPKKRSGKKHRKPSPCPRPSPVTESAPCPRPLPVPTPLPVPPPDVKTCTDCNPEGNMCRPITIRDIFKLFNDEKCDKHVRYFARKLLANIKCLPAEVGREFWKDFDYTPAVYSCPPTETCHCGKKRDECKCVSSNFKVECEGVRLEEFNFHYPSIESKDGEVTLYPFGCGCVPSPLKICERAKFTIFAVKRHLNNGCCSKCKNPETCTHQVSKGDEKAVNYDYVIQWVYDRLMRGETINEDGQKMICCTLRSLKDKACELSPDMYEKYCYIHRHLVKDCAEYSHERPRRERSSRKERSRSRSSSRSRSRSRSQSKDSARSRSRSRSRSESKPRKASPQRERSRSRSQSKSPRSETASRRERSRSRSESKPRKESKSPPEDTCDECGYPKAKCKESCPSRRHRHKSPVKETRPKKKKECPVPVVPESPFAVFHVSGQWVCETVPCFAACSDDAKGVRYRLVLNERDLEHVDGGQVCEGWGLFTCKRYTSVFFKMECQFLPFQPLTPQVITDCGC